MKIFYRKRKYKVTPSFDNNFKDFEEVWYRGDHNPKYKMSNDKISNAIITTINKRRKYNEYELLVDDNKSRKKYTRSDDIHQDDIIRNAVEECDFLVYNEEIHRIVLMKMY